MLSIHKLAILKLADNLLFEVKERVNPYSIEDQKLIQSIARNINSIRAIINKSN